MTPDSAASYEDYAKRAVELGHKVISSVEHGWQGYYYQCYELAQKYNLKFIFGAEAYWVKDRNKEYEEIDPKTNSPKLNKDGTVKTSKDKTNGHIILLAKNENGRRSINKILSIANENGYYFKPRVDLELLLSLPANDVVVTTACFESGMKVLTDTGYKNIEDVKSGEKVLTHKGTWEKVISPTSRQYTGKMYDLQIEGCFQNIKCTADHKFPTVTKKHGYMTKEIIWKKAEDLIETDRILSIIPEQYDEIHSIKVSDIIGDYIKIENMGRGNKSPIVADEIVIDDLFLKVLGLYAAEGNTNANKNYLCFTLHKKEKNLFEVINKFSNRYLNKNAVIQNKKDTQGMSVVIHSKEMTLLITRLISSGCVNKNVPEFVKRLKPSLQMSFIKGLFLGDGSSTKKDKITFVTVSEQLAYEVVNILERNNIKCGCRISQSRTDRNGVKHRQAYSVDIYSKEFREYWETFKNSNQEYDFSFSTTFSSKTPVVINGNKYFAKKIKSKKTYEYDGLVHCLNVENVHSFKLEGISVHNCVAYWQYEDIDDITLQLFKHFGNNFYLEIQYHNTDKQRLISKLTLELSKKYNIPMIVGLDSHYIYPEQADERQYILEAKHMHYEDEDGWYMDYPDDETVMKRFLQQGVFSQEQIQQAMDNTDVLITFEDYAINNPVFSKDIKLPTLYPELSQEQRNKKYSTLISKLFKEYIKTNNITGDEYKRYFDGVKMEVQTVKDTGMADYFLLDYEIVKKAISMGGVLTDTGRGSSVGYFTNTLLGFSKVDRFKSPITLYPERFISKTRILETHSLPD